MPVFKISTVTRSGSVIATTTVDTAKQALAKLRHTEGAATKVWVNDEEGNDVSENDLERRAALEDGGA